TTVHCDHLIRAKEGSAKALSVANAENREVYEFLRQVSDKFGIGFWKPGAGIIHQVVLEQYAFPGGMMIGTDSHTPNAGGLGMFASGVGGADAVDVMAGLPWEVLYPKVVGVKLTGEMKGWTSPKDVILYLLGVLTCDGGTNRVIEYFGPGTKSISCTGKATITNMGAELGATTSIFPYDERMKTYLRATERGALADLANARRAMLRCDADVEANPHAYFDRVVEIDLSKLEPHVVGPHRPDLARPVSKLAEDVKAKNYPEKLSFALIGSCTNSSYEDMSRAADVANQATAHGAKVASPLMATPGSEQVHQTILRDGQMASLEAIGATVLANACGPCIGQWARTDGVKEGMQNSIFTSYNRNFPKRNDGLAATSCFIGSPEITVAYALAGRLTWNPLTDSIVTADGKAFRLDPPKPAPEIPAKGYVKDESGYAAPAADGSGVQIAVDPKSERLQLLEPFAAWDGKDYEGLPLLLKAKGQCTTDHISPAGVWLKYRGHLDRISDNMFLAATNAFTGEAGKGMNLLTGAKGETFSKSARAYKAKGLRWVAVGDQNYGEGSSREHAAMSPRFLGAAAVITRSFARIHESNLKKQGILPLTFVDPKDYEKVQEQDKVSILGLSGLAPGHPLRCKLMHIDGTSDEFLLKHTLNNEQIAWFKAGSALNKLRDEVKAKQLAGASA
ncbi:MAG TPA: aconitate hydratase, partial [Planctomycetota bacterium]|nr:aconitate hydratase [Planctomycetota bacterium]